MTVRHDAGLAAVARVRGARERDSRIGLQQAAAEHRAKQERVLDLRAQLEELATPDHASVAAFVLHHELSRALSEVIEEAVVEADAAAGIAASARAHWQHDKTRLSAVEMLLERRADERRAERRRLETRDLDEVVTQQWLRARTGGAA
jgi:flagellar export protein FliJ